MRLSILRVRTGLTVRPLGEGALRRGRVQPHLPRGRKRAAPRAQRSERAAGCRPRGHAAQPHRAPQASCSARRCPNSDQTASMQFGSVREPPNRDLEKERRLAKEMVSTPKLIFSPRKPASRLRRRKMPSGKAIENPAVQAPSDTHSLSWRSSRPSNGQYAKSQTGHRRPSLSNTAIISKTAAIKAEDQIPGMRKYPDARARRGHFRAGQFTLGSKTARGTSYACRGPNPAGREARASRQRPIRMLAVLAFAPRLTCKPCSIQFRGEEWDALHQSKSASQQAGGPTRTEDVKWCCTSAGLGPSLGESHAPVLLWGS